MKELKKCKICDELTKNTYCSNKCKFSDKELNKRRIRLTTNDSSKIIKCKHCNWSTKDINNLGGHALKHLIIKHQLQVDKLSYLDEYILDDKELKEILQCPECNWSTVDIKNKSGAFTKHIEDIHEYNILQFIDKYPKFKSVWDTFLINNKELDDYITCLICNQKFEKLSNTHLLIHNLDMVQYKEKYPFALTVNARLKDLHSKVTSKNNLTREYSYQSKPEKELVQFLNSYNIETISSYKKLGIELDIFLPELNIAIEYNGLRYHSEWFGKKIKHYHLNKTEICENNNIRLIHIFEDEYISKKDIVLDKLLHICNLHNNKLYARKLSVKQIEYSVAKEFLNLNHIQGATPGSYHYGLFNSDVLVAVASFTRLRKSLGQKSSSTDIELLRYSSLSGITVIGGMLKLIHQFKRDNLEYSKLISYADKRWSSKLSNIYQKSRFNLIVDGSPNYWYILGNRRLHRFNFTKSKILSKGGDSSLTEIQNMRLNGYDRIWDCGTLKYELNLNDL